MDRTNQHTDKIGVVSAYVGLGLGQVKGPFGEITQELSFLDAICKLFGENRVMVVELDPRSSGAR